MNPVLRKLSGPPRSLTDIADLLERHIGTDANPIACKEAFDALVRIRKDNPSFHLRAALRRLDGEGEPCKQVRAVIATIRRWRYHSGA